MSLVLDIILDFVLEIIINGVISGANSKCVPFWIRLLLALLILFILLGLTVLLLLVGIDTHSPALCILGVLFIVISCYFLFDRIRKLLSRLP